MADGEKIITLKDHFDMQIADLKEQLTMQITAVKETAIARAASIQEATRVALESMLHKLAEMNEWRGESKDRQAEFPTRTEIAGQIKSVQVQLDALKEISPKFVQINELNLVVDRLKADIKDLQIAKASLEGKASQQSVNTAFIMAIISITIGIVGIILKFVE